MAPAAFLPADSASSTKVSEVDRDSGRPLELGYRQELRRRLGGLDNVAMGFATISPSVGLYAVRLGRLGTVANALAVAWLAFETVNIAWPRASLAPAGAPSYQVWPAPLVLAIIGGTGLIYVLVAKPLENLGPRTRTTRASARA